MNWYQEDKEMKFQADRAAAAVERKKLMRELKAMQDAQPRPERVGLLAVLAARLRARRRAKVSADERAMTPTGKVATGSGR